MGRDAAVRTKSPPAAVVAEVMRTFSVDAARPASGRELGEKLGEVQMVAATKCSRAMDRFSVESTGQEGKKDGGYPTA